MNQKITTEIFRALKSHISLWKFKVDMTAHDPDTNSVVSAYENPHLGVGAGTLFHCFRDAQWFPNLFDLWSVELL